MDPAVIVLLTFLIYRPADGRAGEEGEVVYRGTCAQAEAWVRAGLRPGQDVLIYSCTPRPVVEAGR